MLLVKEGKTEYSILISSDSSESIKLAAEGLQGLILQCTGAKLCITNVAKAPYISIGETSEFEKLGVTLDAKELNDDGFKILFRDGNIFLCGAKERGTVYAANDFAERYLGVRFLTADEAYTPFTDSLQIEEKDVTEIPSFASRCFFSTIRKIPVARITVATSFIMRLLVSPKQMIARRTVNTVLDLSIGTTLLMSPIESALK